MLNQQKSFGNNQFPNTIMKASKILSNHLYKSNKTKLNQRNQTHVNKKSNQK